MIAVRLHEHVSLHGVQFGHDREVPVVAALPPELQKKAEDLPFLSGWLRFLESMGGTEEDFREILRESDEFAVYAEADFEDERRVLTFGEATALVELGLAEPVDLDLGDLEAEVEEWRRARPATADG